MRDGRVTCEGSVQMSRRPGGQGPSPLGLAAMTSAALPPASVTVRVPAKVNLELLVGAPRDDGYHPLVDRLPRRRASSTR